MRPEGTHGLFFSRPFRTGKGLFCAHVPGDESSGYFRMCLQHITLASPPNYDQDGLGWAAQEGLPLMLTLSLWERDRVRVKTVARLSPLASSSQPRGVTSL